MGIYRLYTIQARYSFRLGPRGGGVRRVTCAETPVKRSVPSPRRPVYVPRVTLAPGALHDTRRVTRVRRSCTPAALPVTRCTARQPRWHRQAARRALSALLSTPLAATHGTGASSEISRSVQQPPNIEARRCMLLRCMSRAHEIRRQRMHAMLWDELCEGLAALRE